MPLLKNLVFALAAAKATQAQLNLGPAKSFGTIAGSQLVNTGTTSVLGDIGTWPGVSITGYPPGIYSGSINPGTPTAQIAEKYCYSAFVKAFALPSTGVLSTNIGGLVLPPGVYTFQGANVFLNNVVTLDGASDPNGQWVFLIKGYFTTATASAVLIINGGQACNVYFAVGQSASLADSTRFEGNILANDTIKAGTAATNLGTFCTLNGPIATWYNKLQSYIPICFN